MPVKKKGGLSGSYTAFAFSFSGYGVCNLYCVLLESKNLPGFE